MEMPRGWRSSEPRPADGQGQRPQQGRHGGHHDGPEPQQAGLIDGLLRGLAFPALGIQGKVHHHDAVFLDDADQQDDADQGDDAELGAAEEQGQNRPDPGRRQGGDDGDGVDIALVQHPQDDVDRHQGRQDQERFVVQRGLEGQGRTLETAPDAGRQAQLLGGGLHGLHRLTQGDPRRQVERQGRGRKLPLVADDERTGGLLDPGDGAQRHLAAAGAADIERPQVLGVLLEVGLDLQDDAVLVQLGEDRGD